MADARATTYQVEPDFAARQSVVWSIAWLVGGASLLLLVQLLLIFPSILPGVVETKLFGIDLHFALDYGTLRTIAEHAVTFGWLGTVMFAAVYSLLPRLAQVQLHNEALGAATTLTWGAVLTGGFIGLLLTSNQGRPLGELGAAADLGILLLLVFVLYNAGVTVARRREKTMYVSGWYLLAAVLALPILFLIGNLPLFTGVTSSLVSGFYLNGLEMLWLVPVALGIAHYVIPVQTGGELYSYALSRAGFWSLMFAGGWCGTRYVVDGVAPDYIESVGVGMTIVLLIPILTSVVNLFSTGHGRWHLASLGFGLRFAAAGLGLLAVWIVLTVVSTLPDVARFFAGTAWGSGVRFLAIFGAFTSIGFALIYHMYPLMTGRDWYSRPVAAFHFWATQIGVVLATTMLLATGAAQSLLVGTAAPEGPDVIGLLRIATALSFFLVVAAQYAFAYNMFRTSRAGPFVTVVGGMPVPVEAQV